MFTVTIETENAAFSGDAFRGEIIRILATATPKLTNPATAGSVHELVLRDVNGNRVGSMRWTREEHNNGNDEQS